jgi:glycosyltransferase involved in cell wall biosynthesis
MPDAQLRLDLVGAPYKDAEALAQEIELIAKSDRHIRWYRSVSRKELLDLYSQCDFTVYPSLMEGFGLPILESLWLGQPCVCANFGAMAETAAGGGCLTVDIREPEQLAGAIVTLATQSEVRDRLTSEIKQRPFKHWSEYAEELCSVLSDTGETLTGSLRG